MSQSKVWSLCSCPNAQCGGSVQIPKHSVVTLSHHKAQCDGSVHVKMHTLVALYTSQSTAWWLCPPHKAQDFVSVKHPKHGVSTLSMSQSTVRWLCPTPKAWGDCAFHVTSTSCGSVCIKAQHDGSDYVTNHSIVAVSKYQSTVWWLHLRHKAQCGGGSVQFPRHGVMALSTSRDTSIGSVRVKAQHDGSVCFTKQSVVDLAKSQSTVRCLCPNSKALCSGPVHDTWHTMVVLPCHKPQYGGSIKIPKQGLVALSVTQNTVLWLFPGHKQGVVALSKSKSQCSGSSTSQRTVWWLSPNPKPQCGGCVHLTKHRTVALPKPQNMAC